MGWFSDVFDGIKGSDFVQGIGTIIAGNRVTSANNRAADMIRSGNEQALGAATAGNTAARADLAQLRAAGAPGVAHITQVVAGQPGVLQPWQAEKVRQMRQQAGTALSKPLGGRSAVAAADELATRGEMNFLQQNQQRQDAAGGQLAGMYGQGVAGSANLNQNAGNTAAKLVSDTGMAQAGATTANAAVDGQTMANALSSVFARGDQEARRSRYMQPQP